MTLTDAEGNITTFAYDKNNKLTSETRPGGQVTTYGYDGNGRLISRVDAKNQKITHNYDDTGQLTRTEHYATASNVTPVKTINFTYDSLGNLKSYDDGASNAIYDYDALSRKISETVDYGPFSLNQQYGFYANGLKKTYTGPDGQVTFYAYDSNNQLAAVEVPGQGYVTIPSYTWTRPDSINFPGGVGRNFVYDPLMRVTNISATASDLSMIMNYGYTYDKESNITTKLTEHGAYNHTYDELYRLTDSVVPTLDDETYTYDKVSNRLSAEDVLDQWAYNTNNELLDGDGLSFTYDDNGNTISRSFSESLVHAYSYDVDDRLVVVKDDTGGVTATYGYDPFGRRLWKVVGSVTTYFVYSDEGLVGEYDIVGNEIKAYGYLPGSTWTTDPFFMKEDTAFYWYINDHLGTPQMLVSNNGAVVWAAKYDSFGKATVSPDSTITNNLRFPGQMYDAETGMHYNYWRTYDPATGRYLTPDPIGLAGGMNLFLYANANPIMFIDPFGLWSAGFGAYAGLGGDVSYTSTTCCKGGKQVQIKYLTFCGGAGIGGKLAGGKSLSGSGQSFSIGVSTYGNSCPKTGDMFVAQQATVAVVVGGTVTAQAGNRGFGAEASGTLGLGASLEALKLCAVIVLDESVSSECCESEGERLTDTPWQ